MKSSNNVQSQSSTSKSSTSTVPVDHASVDAEAHRRQQQEQAEGPAAALAGTNQKVTKVTVCFGTVRVVVPCGEGELRVCELIDRAVYRYRKATNKLSSCWLVTVLNLKTSVDNAILDPSDKLRDVVDDREQIIAVYSECSRNTGSGPPAGGTTGFNGGIPAGAAGDCGGRMDGVASSCLCRPEVPGLAACNSTETLKPCHSAPMGMTADEVVAASSHVSRMQQCNRTKAAPQCCCASHVKHLDRLQRCNNGEDRSVLVTFSNVVESLGVHVVPAIDCTGRNYGLTIHTIEPGGTVDSDKRLQVQDTITNINGTSLLGVDFVSAQEIFKRYLPSGELRLQVIKHSVNPGVTPDLRNSGPSTRSATAFQLASEDQIPVPPRTTSLTSSRVVRGSTSHQESGTSNGCRRDELDKMPEQEEISRMGRSPSAPPSVGHRVRFLPPTNTRVIGNKLTINLVKGVEGLGFSITTRDNPAGGNCPIYIKNILPRGAAIDDGCLQAGDRLLQVNDVEVTGKSQSEVAVVLRSLPLNDNVRLIVSRHDVADSNGIATDSTERLMTGSEVEVEVEAAESMPHSRLSSSSAITAETGIDSTQTTVNNSQQCTAQPAAGILKNKDNYKAAENRTEETKDLMATDSEENKSATGCTEETASVQAECDSSATFSREGFGRQSMSEKRKGHIDPKVSAVYRRIRQTKEGYATASLDRRRVFITKKAAAASLLRRSPDSLAPTLRLTKSSSLESLQTAVNEIMGDDDCAQSPSLAKLKVGEASTSRGFNNSFRSAVDRSFNSKENCCPSDENSVNKLIETNQNETTLSRVTTTASHVTDSSLPLEEVSTVSENHQTNTTDVTKKNKQRDKSKTRFKGLGAILRFGKSRKKSTDRCNGVTTATSPEIERKVSVDWQLPLEPEPSTRNLPPPDVLSRALEKQRERGGMSQSSSSREPSGERSLCSLRSQSARQRDHPSTTSRDSREAGTHHHNTSLQRRMHRQLEEDAVNSRDETDQRSNSGNFHTLGNFLHQNGCEATSHVNTNGRQFSNIAHSSSVQPSPSPYYHGRFSSVPVNMLPEEDNSQYPSHFSSAISMCNGAPSYNCNGYLPSSLQEHFPWASSGGNAYPNGCREISPDGFFHRQEFSASSSGTADISAQFCYHQHDYRIPVPPYWYRPGFSTVEPTTGRMYHRRVVSHTASDAYLRLPQAGPLQDRDFDRVTPGIPDYRSLQVRKPAVHGRKEHAVVSSSALV